jgi:hypothetical protein
MLRFSYDLISRVARAGATGRARLLTADSGFWLVEAFARRANAGWQYTIGVRLQPDVPAAIERIEQAAWQTLADHRRPAWSDRRNHARDQRLVVCRVRTLTARRRAGPDLGVPVPDR